MTLTAVRAATPARPPRRPSRLLWAGVLAGPLFVVTFLLAGAFRDDYDPVRHPVSSLALGPGGWVQVVNFVVTGLLTVLFAIGLRRTARTVAVPLLVAVWGVALIGAGAFRTDPVSGYPAGTPAFPDSPTWQGAVHDLVFSLPGFVALAAAMFADVRRSRWSALPGVAFVVLFVLASAGFAQASPFVDVAGLLQRLAVGIGLLWMALIAVRTRRFEPS